MSDELWKANTRAIKRLTFAREDLSDLMDRRGPVRAPVLMSQNGLPIPCAETPQGPIPLHSRYDPEKEGRRWIENASLDGTAVVWGLGGAYHIRPLLGVRSLKRLFLLEADETMFLLAMTIASWEEIFADPRVVVLALWPEDRLFQALARVYSPILHGALTHFPLRPALQAHPETFATLRKAWDGALERLKGDWATQGQFGRRWMKNLLANLSLVRSGTFEWQPARAVVFGAGPSLDFQIKHLDHRPDDLKIATDTALPALLAYGLKPDLVVSIDPQIIGFHHLAAGFPQDLPFLFDLSSPPPLARKVPLRFFFASAHPLARLLAEETAAVPSLDASGGNVAYVALQLAAFFRAREILILGADFAYPQGKSYAKATYVHPFFDSRQGRREPLESQFFAFAFRHPRMIRYRGEFGIGYTNPLLLGYKEALERAVKGIASPVRAAPGWGWPWEAPPRSEDAAPASFRRPLANLAAPDLRGWLSRTAERWKALPDWHEGLTAEQKSLWACLFPQAYTLLKEGTSGSPQELLGLAREEILRETAFFVK